MKPSHYLHTSILATFTLVGSANAITPTIAGGNGSFESGTATTAAGPRWGAYGLNEVTINDWTLTNPDGGTYSNGLAAWLLNNNSTLGNSSDGNFFVNVESGPDWWLTAPITGLTVGTTYTVSFDTRKRADTAAGTFDVFVNSTVASEGATGGFNVSASSTNWEKKSFTFVAAAETVSLVISNTDNPTGNGYMVDNFTIAETAPDPWTPDNGIWTGGDGEWNTATHWLNSTIGNGIDMFATFNGSTPITATVNVNRPIGALNFSGADHTVTASTGSLTLDGDTIFPSPTVTVADGITATIAAPLHGSEGLLKSGIGTLLLSGPNSYSGTTEIGEGTLKYQDGSFTSETHTIVAGAVLEFHVASGTYNGAATTINGSGTLRKTGIGNLIWPATSATFALAPGALIDVQEGTFTAGSYGNENWSANVSDLNVADGATFSTVEANVRLNKITGSGMITSGYGGAGYQNLIIGVDGGSSTFNGVIANKDAPAKLVKTGAGTITLSGINTYTGNTTIDDGTLELADDAQLKFVVSDTSSNTMSGNATATLKGDFTIDTSAVTGTQNGTWQLVNLSSLAPASSFDATFTVIGFTDPENDGIWTLTDPKGDWAFSETTGALTLDIGDDYLGWANSFNPTIGLPTADDDSDGLTNFEEYAFGLNPTSASSANPIATTLDKTSGTFSYIRRLQSKTNLAFTVRSSTTLATDGWTDLIKNTDYTEAVSTAGDLETVTVTLTPVPTADKLFIQVKAATP